MNFKLEFIRLFDMWIKEVEESGENVQAMLIKAVKDAFLKWYG